MSPPAPRPRKRRAERQAPIYRVFVALYEASDVAALDAVPAALVAQPGPLGKAAVIRTLIRHAPTRLPNR